ncbi:MAG: hypothetical protein ONB48_03450 [candidate division KSB1 bacterium]|nr:hypothetical protein [candidate division KSB1 bacterium]MDZ7275605.1 hypothetical protein [candidate division KSB1 bacterium]MDZ7284704.1 hypothetical protein [candidate division KSB1 bacterium]MDZ7297877.1 hypothetical protein [candidate division KSB1 bacterium]MDZ7305995.1 hypothetical protein [candidate division KSB1 bacterium]
MASLAAADEAWYKSYENGRQAVERGDWSSAASHFAAALAQKSRDTNKIRAYGTVFIQYYPNRELGICYYHLGDLQRARQYLELSLSQSPSARAQEYLDKIRQGPAPQTTVSTPAPPAPTKPTARSVPPAEPAAAIVGDRLSIAILPFETKGIGSELGEIDLLDKITTVFFNLHRFKVIERAQLEKILAEQQLGMTGVIDVSTAAQIGKGIGVDAVVCGSIARTGNAASIDARLIDTETAAIITAQDAFANTLNLQALTQMIQEAAQKMRQDLPLVTGYVIKVEPERLTLDLGRNQGVRKGMKCHIYREGAPIVHPVTNEVIGKTIDELCEAQLTDVFEAYSVAIITKPKAGSVKISDRVVTK